MVARAQCDQPDFHRADRIAFSRAEGRRRIIAMMRRQTGWLSAPA
jgi:hypothetical protein